MIASISTNIDFKINSCPASFFRLAQCRIQRINSLIQSERSTVRAESGAKIAL